MSLAPMDRRSFMGRIVVTAGGGVAALLLPVSLLHAREVAACVAARAYPDMCGDWTLDDMCNAYPGYTFQFQRSAASPLMATAVSDADQLWVA